MRHWENKTIGVPWKEKAKSSLTFWLFVQCDDDLVGPSESQRGETSKILGFMLSNFILKPMLGIERHTNAHTSRGSP